MNHLVPLDVLNQRLSSGLVTSAGGNDVRIEPTVLTEREYAELLPESSFLGHTVPEQNSYATHLAWGHGYRTTNHDLGVPKPETVVDLLLRRARQLFDVPNILLELSPGLFNPSRLDMTDELVMYASYEATGHRMNEAPLSFTPIWTTGASVAVTRHGPSGLWLERGTIMDLEVQGDPLAVHTDIPGHECVGCKARCTKLGARAQDRLGFHADQFNTDSTKT